MALRLHNLHTHFTMQLNLRFSLIAKYRKCSHFRLANILVPVEILVCVVHTATTSVDRFSFYIGVCADAIASIEL